MFDYLSISQKRTINTVLKQGIKLGFSIIELQKLIEEEIFLVTSEIESNVWTKPSAYKTSLNEKCSICGHFAKKVPVNTDRGNTIGGEYTHAIQCQNRPATDKPWLITHCGHTEYITE